MGLQDRLSKHFMAFGVVYLDGKEVEDVLSEGVSGI